MAVQIRLGVVLLLAASVCGIQGCASGERHARSFNYEPDSALGMHRIAERGVLSDHLEDVFESVPEQALPAPEIRSVVAASRGWMCNVAQEEANQKAIAYFQNQLQIARLYKAEIMAVTTTTNMDAIFTPLGQQMIGEGYKVPYYTCSPSYTALAGAYNQYAGAFNDAYTSRIPLLYRIVDGAEADLGALSAAKDRLMAALRTGPGPATTAARLSYRQALARLREYRLQDFYVDAKLGGGTARTFKASDFWSRANAVMYQDVGDDYTGYTIAEILGSPTGANLTITTSNSIATIEVRHMSYGPGFCTVETKSSLGAGNVAAAPPLVYGPWHPIEAHAGAVTLTITTEAKCDTGARSQVRYFK